MFHQEDEQLNEFVKIALDNIKRSPIGSPERRAWSELYQALKEVQQGSAHFVVEFNGGEGPDVDSYFVKSDYIVNPHSLFDMRNDIEDHLNDGPEPDGDAEVSITVEFKANSLGLIRSLYLGTLLNYSDEFPQVSDPILQGVLGWTEVPSGEVGVAIGDDEDGQWVACFGNEGDEDASDHPYAVLVNDLTFNSDGSPAWPDAISAHQTQEDALDAAREYAKDYYDGGPIRDMDDPTGGWFAPGAPPRWDA